MYLSMRRGHAPPAKARVPHLTPSIACVPTPVTRGTRDACTDLIMSRLQGTFGVIVVYVTLCARVVLHALAAYRRVRNSEPPQPRAPAKAVDGACAGAQPTRGSLLVMLPGLYLRRLAAW